MRLIHRQAEKLEEMQKLTSELEKSPAVKLMRQEQEAETLKKRKAAAVKLDELEAEALKLAENPEMKALGDELHILEKKRLEIQAKLNEARGRWMQRKGGVAGQINYERDFLYSCYDPEIDTAVDFFRKTLDDLRSPGVVSTQRSGGHRNIFTGKQKQKFESNFDSVQDALKFCQKSIELLENEKLKAVFDVEKIEALKAGIPEIAYSKSESEQNLSGLMKGVG
jgi:hypothetical protein